MKTNRNPVILWALAGFFAADLGASAEIARSPAEPRTPMVLATDRSARPAPTTLRLAKGGKALQKIVLAPQASEAVQATAAYLASKLEKISGARFEVTVGDGRRGIVLGTIRDFPVAELEKPLELRPVVEGTCLRNGVEAYGIRTESERLLLLGGGDLGVSHAASRFLDLLGYRRFYPAPEWEIVPSLPELAFNHNETDRPAILSRVIWHAFGLPDDAYLAGGETSRAKVEIGEWNRQNRLGESYKVFAAHIWQNIYRLNAAEYEAHPEYAGVYEGQRLPGLVCVSNPAVRAMLVKFALEYFAKNPDADMCSMERNDGDKICQCAGCQALGDDSARVFGLANEVARAVRDKYPGKMIGVLAYNTHDLPPPFVMEPNVHVSVARLFIRSGNTFPQLLDLWSKKTPLFGVYDYFSTYQWGQDRFRRKGSEGPTADLALLRQEIPLIAEKGALCLRSESSVAWGAHGRGNLVATRLMWNPAADVESVLTDFYEKAFGPAAPAMKRYFEAVDDLRESPEPNLGKPRSPESRKAENEAVAMTLKLAFREVHEAAKLAKDRPDVQARLDQIKQFLHYNKILYQFVAAADKEEQKELTLERLTHEFRTRFSYMTHWHAAKWHLGKLAEKFSEPSWALPTWRDVARKKKEGVAIAPPPWLVEKGFRPDANDQRTLPQHTWLRARDAVRPYTQEETERLFQDDMVFFNGL